MAYDIDAGPIIQTLYVARRLDLPPLTAQAAFDAHRGANGGDASTVIETPTTQLWLEGAGLVDRVCRCAPLRQVPGRLRRRAALVSVPVEVEVTPWSDMQCEVGMRPCRRTVPLADCRRQRRYLDLAVEAVEGLVQMLENRVDDWMLTVLADVDATAPSRD